MTEQNRAARNRPIPPNTTTTKPTVPTPRGATVDSERLHRLPAEVVTSYIFGWNITPYGRPDAGMVVGPCARCHEPSCRYGDHGQTHCPDCRPRGWAAW